VLGLRLSVKAEVVVGEAGELPFTVIAKSEAVRLALDTEMVEGVVVTDPQEPLGSPPVAAVLLP
jgi:hypothetical protein